MAVTEEFTEEFSERGECYGAELDEGLCINYHPGLLAEIEDEVNEERERAVFNSCFCGCGN
jgi:hypothetical protein